MKITVVSLFPDMIRAAAGHSIVKRGMEAGYFSLDTIDPRSFTSDRHRTVDDTPFGGGAGMVLKPGPYCQAIRTAKAAAPGATTVLLCPTGKPFSQEAAARYAEKPGLILVCGHYEGFDERIRAEADETISLGDYVLTGGELPALVVLDAVCRLVPGVVGHQESVEDESFLNGLLEYPQYTRPIDFEGALVPEALRSGDHDRIARWRRKESLRRTWRFRPEMLKTARLLPEDGLLLLQLLMEEEQKDG